MVYAGKESSYLVVLLAALYIIAPIEKSHWRLLGDAGGVWGEAFGIVAMILAAVAISLITAGKSFLLRFAFPIAILLIYCILEYLFRFSLYTDTNKIEIDRMNVAWPTVFLSIIISAIAILRKRTSFVIPFDKNDFIKFFVMICVSLIISSHFLLYRMPIYIADRALFFSSIGAIFGRILPLIYLTYIVAGLNSLLKIKKS